VSLLWCRELSSIFPEKWLAAVLGRAADMAQPSARQQALSILDLMADAFEPEVLLGALGKSLTRLRTARAKAKAIEYGTSIVQGCPDLLHPGNSYDGAPGTLLAPLLRVSGPRPLPLAHRWNAPVSQAESAWSMPAPGCLCGFTSPGFGTLKAFSACLTMTLRLAAPCCDFPGSMAKAVRTWGTRLMHTVTEAKFRQEAMAGVVACAGSIGPQFIVAHLETMPPAVSLQSTSTGGTC